MFEIERKNQEVDYTKLKDSDYYYHFEGNPMSNREITEAINDIIKKLLNEDYGTHYSIETGSTSIIGVKYQYGSDPKDGGYIKINICHDYEELELPLDSIKKTEK